MPVDVAKIAETIVALERSLNERWSTGDCHGYLDAYAEDISYFDPVLERLLIGRPSVVEHILKLYKNPQIVRNEYLNEHVTVSDSGDVAVLGYNLNTFVADADKGEKLLTAWNSTEVYRRIDGAWRIVHSNWALTRQAGTTAAF